MQIYFGYYSCKMSFCPTKIPSGFPPMQKDLAFRLHSYLVQPKGLSKTRDSFSLMNAEEKHRGRPPLTTGKRIKKVDVRFTELEYEEVLKMESALGINRSDLIRIRVLAGSKGIVINAISLLGQLDTIGAEMGRAGNNINQLAKYSNILKNEGILSPVVVERFLILLESYLKDQRQMEAAIRKILRTMNQPAI